MIKFRYVWTSLLLALLAFAFPVFAAGSAAHRVSELGKALRAQNVPGAEKLIESGPIPNRYTDGECWYQIATIQNMPELFEPLKDAGVPIECIDVRGTPLQDAISTRHYRAARELIRLGANLNPKLGVTKAVSSSPPLTDVIFYYTQGNLRGAPINKNKPESVQQTELKLIKYMLDQGADPNALDKGGDGNALTLASEVGSTKLVKWLLAAGADPNQLIRNKTKSATALEVAVLGGKSNIETVEALLYAGADPTIGTYAVDLIKKAKKTMPKAVPLLKQYGAC